METTDNAAAVRIINELVREVKQMRKELKEIVRDMKKDVDYTESR